MFASANRASFLPLEGVAFVFSALIRDWKRIGAILAAVAWNMVHFPMLIRKHIETRRTRTAQHVQATMKRMFSGSIFFEYFLLGRKRVRDIPGEVSQ